jgi:hypothetical protein
MVGDAMRGTSADERDDMMCLLQCGTARPRAGAAMGKIVAIPEAGADKNSTPTISSFRKLFWIIWVKIVFWSGTGGSTKKPFRKIGFICQ